MDPQLANPILKRDWGRSTPSRGTLSLTWDPTTNKHPTTPVSKTSRQYPRTKYKELLSEWCLPQISITLGLYLIALPMLMCRQGPASKSKWDGATDLSMHVQPESSTLACIEAAVFSVPVCVVAPVCTCLAASHDPGSDLAALVHTYLRHLRQSAAYGGWHKISWEKLSVFSEHASGRIPKKSLINFLPALASQVTYAKQLPVTGVHQTASGRWGWPRQWLQLHCHPPIQVNLCLHCIRLRQAGDPGSDCPQPSWNATPDPGEPVSAHCTRLRQTQVTSRHLSQAVADCLPAFPGDLGVCMHCSITLRQVPAIAFCKHLPGICVTLYHTAASQTGASHDKHLFYPASVDCQPLRGRNIFVDGMSCWPNCRLVNDTETMGMDSQRFK